MKGLFPQYEELTQHDFDQAWKHGLLVFDTNVLLNLYRYHSATRDELIEVVGQLSRRIWIPHHVALEFQRNRLKVIAEQNRRFSEVRRTVEKARGSLFGELDKLQLRKRHALINPEPLTSGFSDLVDTFLSELENLRQSQQSLTAPDPLKAKIEAVFEGRVGAAPENQQSIDDAYKEADRRYKLKIPPGYEDSDKDKDEPDEHLHCGIIYKRKFGDFLIWQQMLSHAKVVNAQQLIFVTDDNKEDWWRKLDADGPKVVGPRAELVEEALLEGGVKNFLMYSPEGFLKYAKEYLKAKVSEETLKEVRDVSQARTKIQPDMQEFRGHARRAERAVLNWLLSKFQSVKESRSGFPDFIVSESGRRLGFEVRIVSSSKVLFHRIRDALFRAYYEIEESGLSEVSIVIVAPDPEAIEDTRRVCMKIFPERMPGSVRVIIGVLDEGLSDEPEFIPYDDFSWEEANNMMGQVR